jgi:hypothetical protein
LLPGKDREDHNASLHETRLGSIHQDWVSGSDPRFRSYHIGREGVGGKAMMQKSTQKPLLSELYAKLEMLLEHAPAHGKITLTIHIRDNLAQRYEVTRDESVMIAFGGSR